MSENEFGGGVAGGGGGGGGHRGRGKLMFC